MEYQVTANPEVVAAPQVEGDPAEPGLAKGVIKLPGVLFVAIATMAPGAGAAYSISTGALFRGGAPALSSSRGPIPSCTCSLCRIWRWCSATCWPPPWPPTEAADSPSSGQSG